MVIVRSHETLRLPACDMLLEAAGQRNYPCASSLPCVSPELTTSCSFWRVTSRKQVWRPTANDEPTTTTKHVASTTLPQPVTWKPNSTTTEHSSHFAISSRAGELPAFGKPVQIH